MRHHLLTCVKKRIKYKVSNLAQHEDHFPAFVPVSVMAIESGNCFPVANVLKYKLAEGLKLSDYFGTREQRTKHCHMLRSVSRQGYSQASVSAKFVQV